MIPFSAKKWLWQLWQRVIDVRHPEGSHVTQSACSDTPSVSREHAQSSVVNREQWTVTWHLAVTHSLGDTDLANTPTLLLTDSKTGKPSAEYSCTAETGSTPTPAPTGGITGSIRTAHSLQTCHHFTETHHGAHQDDGYVQEEFTTTFSKSWKRNPTIQRMAGRLSKRRRKMVTPTISVIWEDAQEMPNHW